MMKPDVYTGISSRNYLAGFYRRVDALVGCRLPEVEAMFGRGWEVAPLPQALRTVARLPVVPLKPAIDMLHAQDTFDAYKEVITSMRFLGPQASIVAVQSARQPHEWLLGSIDPAHLSISAHFLERDIRPMIGRTHDNPHTQAVLESKRLAYAIVTGVTSPILG